MDARLGDILSLFRNKYLHRVIQRTRGAYLLLVASLRATALAHLRSELAVAAEPVLRAHALVRLARLGHATVLRRLVHLVRLGVAALGAGFRSSGAVATKAFSSRILGGQQLLRYAGEGKGKKELTVLGAEALVRLTVLAEAIVLGSW